MFARLLRDALERVPAASRVSALDADIRAWSDRLSRLAASTQRDPYLRQAPEILAAGAGLASRARAAAGYSEVAALLVGLLAGLQPPALALDRARASLDALRGALAAAELAGAVDEIDRDELLTLEAALNSVIAAHSAPSLPLSTRTDG